MNNIVMIVIIITNVIHLQLPVGKAMNNIVLFIAFPASCGYNSQYLWRRSGGMLFVYSLLELRTLPNELLIL